MGKRTVSILLISIMIFFYVVMSVGATTTQDLNQAKDKEQTLDKQLDDVKSDIEQITKDKTDVQSYIEAIDQKMQEITDSIYGLNVQIDEKNNEIMNNEALLEQAKQDSAQQYESMKLRIKYMYEHQSESYMEVLLASQDMGDLLNKAEYINKISDYDREMLLKYAQTEQLIQNTEVALQDEKTALEDALDSIEIQEESMELVQDSKSDQLKKLEAQEEQANANQTQLEKDKAAQQAEVADMEAELRRLETEEKAVTASNTSSGTSTIADHSSASLTYDGGNLLWPVPASSRITSVFAETSERTVPHNGIDIGASRRGVEGDQVVAAYDGKVEIARYSSTAGNYIAIRHGNGFYTYYMHNSKLLVSQGDIVTRGQVISLMGNTGSSKGVHLHFGILVNGSYVDPLTYVSP